MLAAVLSSGCYASLSPYRVGDTVAADEVVLVGYAGFEPPFTPPGASGGVIDPGGFLSRVWLGFTYSPDAPVNLAAGMDPGVDVWLAAEPDRPFAVRAPRRPLYLRVIRAHAGTTGWASRGDLQITYLSCTGRHAIDVKPDDVAVYVGSLLCEHDDGAPIGLRAVDQLAALTPWLPKLVGDRALRPAIARDLNPAAPPGGVQGPAHVATRPPPGPPQPPARGAVRPPGGEARPRRESVPPAAPPGVTGTVRLVVNGAAISAPALAASVGAVALEVELDGHGAVLGEDGAFRLPEADRWRRLDHLVFRGEAGARRPLFIPALEIAAGSGCLGTLTLSWERGESPADDGFPALQRQPACGAAPGLEARPARTLGLPEHADSVPVRLLIGLHASAGIALSSGGFGSALGAGFRYRFLRDPAMFGSAWLLASVRAVALSGEAFRRTIATAGASWGLSQGYATIGGQVGVSTTASAPQLALAGVFTSGTLFHDLAIVLRVEWLPGAPAVTIFALSLELSPAGAVGSFL